MPLQDLSLAVDAHLVDGEQPLDVTVPPLQPAVVLCPLFVDLVDQHAVGHASELVSVKPGERCGPDSETMRGAVPPLNKARRQGMTGGIVCPLEVITLRRRTHQKGFF